MYTQNVYTARIHSTYTQHVVILTTVFELVARLVAVTRSPRNVVVVAGWVTATDTRTVVEWCDSGCDERRYCTDIVN